MTRTVVVDVDGVLLDYIPGLWRWAKSKNRLTSEGRDIMTTSNSAEPPQWDIGRYFVDGYLTVHEFYTSSAYGYLRNTMHPHFLQAIKNVGADIVAITAAPSIDEVGRARVLNLALHYGPVFNDIIFTPEDKFAVLAEHGIGYGDGLKKPFCFVEDKPSTLAAGHQLGWPMLGITHKYNRHLIEAEPGLTMFENPEWAFAYIIEELLRGREQVSSL